jgi:hypothetical protein
LCSSFDCDFRIEGINIEDFFFENLTDFDGEDEEKIESLLDERGVDGGEVDETLLEESVRGDILKLLNMDDISIV